MAEVERWCEEVASAALLPEGALAAALTDLGHPEIEDPELVESLSRRFKVSLRAVALRPHPPSQRPDQSHRGERRPEKTGPRLAEVMGCTVRAEALGSGVVALTLSGPAAGAVSFLPRVRPRFPLLVPLGLLGYSVLHVNLAAAPLALAGEEAQSLALSVVLAAAARTSPVHLRVALPEKAGELEAARGLPHAGLRILRSASAAGSSSTRVPGTSRTTPAGTRT